MAEHEHPSAVVQGFVDALVEARAAVEDPSYARIEEVSLRLERERDRRAAGAEPLVSLVAESTTNDILLGKRGSLPKWRWTVSYLVVLRTIAVQDGIDPDAAVGTLAEWKQRYDAARAALRKAPTPASPPSGDLRPVGAGRTAVPVEPPETTPRRPRPPGGVPAGPAPDRADGRDVPPGGDSGRSGGPPGSAETGTARGAAPAARSAVGTMEIVDEIVERVLVADAFGPVTGVVPPPEPTLTLRRYVRAYGRTGMRLLRNAEDGDPEARYRLAVLLACDDRPSESAYWSQRAAEAGHSGARALAGDTDLPYFARGAVAAYRIGLGYEHAEMIRAAVLFFERAAANGHVEAAYRAGLHHVQSGELWLGYELFRRAAANGHHCARHELDVAAFAEAEIPRRS
ncbi:hypothetical protein ACSNOI_19885 [Actinomadura kijaniata]|uniref:hypothetical protein n=1 Tax=Actinomadura kijaniata TaxID=46161 RepID=UPI003F1AF286